MVGGLNTVYKYMLLVIILWTILSVSSSLLTYLALMVEYTLNWNLLTNIWIIFFYHLKSQNDSNLAELIGTLNYIFWSFVALFLISGNHFHLFHYDYSQFVIHNLLLSSELGGRVTTQFNVFDEQLCQSRWYLYPIKLQRIVLIFTLDAQQSVPIRGYGTIVCSREFFQSASLYFWLQSLETSKNI